MNSVLWDLNSDKIIMLAKQGKRADNRKFDEYREISILKDIIKSAEGSARVKIGKTDVIAGVKFFPEAPYPDMPDEGSISVGAELLAIASPEFEVGPPKDDAIELARVVDRGIRESKAIDFKKLCIIPGEKVWIAFIDIYALNFDGNLFDASSLAAIAALNNAKIPKLENNEIVKGEYQDTLALERIPILTTHAKIANSMLLDPTEAEERAMSARFSVATTEDGYICAFQKGMPGTLTKKEVDECIETAFRKSKELRKFV